MWSPRAFLAKRRAKQAAPVKATPFRSVRGTVPLIGPVDASNSSWLNSFSYVIHNDDYGIAITFKDGVTCFYPDTTGDQFDALKAAPSRGTWVHENIIKNKYITL